MSRSDNVWELVKKSSKNLGDDKAYELLLSQKKQLSVRSGRTNKGMMGVDSGNDISPLYGRSASSNDKLDNYRGFDSNISNDLSPNRKELRQVKRGKIYETSTLDLHGRRTNEVAGILERFVFRAIERESKVILVVTGKGTGRLKEAFFDWVRGKGAKYVTSMSVAGRKHGRDGAFYLWIKTKSIEHVKRRK